MKLQRMGGRVLAMKCDVSKFDELNAFVKTTVAKFGTVDILVNVAACFEGVIFNDSVVETEQDIWDKSFAVNVTGPWLLMKLCFPYMKEHGGKIVNIGSGSGIHGDTAVGKAAYCCSKGALHSLTVVEAAELAKYNINVNCVLPGMASETVLGAMKMVNPDINLDCHDDKFWETAISIGVPKPPLNPDHFFPKYVAKVVLFIATDDSERMTGAFLNAEGGIEIHSGGN